MFKLAQLLAPFCLVLIASCTPSRPSADSPPSKPSPSSVAQTSVRSPVQLELERKLSELDQIRKTTDFKYYGMGGGGPYANWDSKLDKSFSLFSLSLQEKAAVEEIKAMAREYARTGGEDSDLTRFTRDKVERAAGLKAQSVPAARSGLGAVTSSSRDVIVGRWRDKRPPDDGHSSIEIFTGPQGLRMVSTYRDGSKITDPLKETPDPRGRKLEDRPDNSFGEYYILTSGGDLQYWSGNRMYYTAERY